MKREILCNGCKNELRELFPTNTPYPGEFLKFIKGKAKQYYICDRCGKDITKDSECWAFSIYTNNYYQWEGEYLELRQQFCCVCGEAIGNRGEMGFYKEGESNVYCQECFSTHEKFTIHGVNCEKIEHANDEYIHSNDDDSIFKKNGITYCGRCHTFF